jgi:hypothetical protein
MAERAHEQAVATVERMPAPASEASAIIHMIERAATNPAVDIDKMERLLDMQERVMARHARVAYAAALAEMQPDLPIIAEKGEIVHSGKLQSTYARWEDINEAIRPVLAKHGFALSFRTGRTDTQIIITGVLSHREGHSEETTMHLPVDTSGSKNAVQAVGSSTSYGKRYTAQALLNLTSRAKDDQDDDGEAGGARGGSAAKQAATAAVNACNTLEELRAWKAKSAEGLKLMPTNEADEVVRLVNDRMRRLKDASGQ